MNQFLYYVFIGPALFSLFVGQWS